MAKKNNPDIFRGMPLHLAFEAQKPSTQLSTINCKKLLPSFKFIYYILQFVGCISMLRTIQVREETYRALEKLKKKMKARSFDEVIEKLILNMFGVDKDVISPFTEK